MITCLQDQEYVTEVRERALRKDAMERASAPGVSDIEGKFIVTYAECEILSTRCTMLRQDLQTARQEAHDEAVAETEKKFKAIYEEKDRYISQIEDILVTKLKANKELQIQCENYQRKIEELEESIRNLEKNYLKVL